MLYLTNFNQHDMQNESYTYTRSNLSAFIESIETVSVLDVVQLFYELIITITCIGGNFLAILVLRHAAVKHPAQALRLTMAFYDLIIGIFGCATGVGFHSYYLCCAIHIEQCPHEVNIIQFHDNKKMFVVLGTFPLIHFIILWVAIACNMHLTAIMSVERYFALCKPLRHRIYFTISNNRKILFALPTLLILESLTWKSLETTELKWSGVYTPDAKTLAYKYTDEKYVL